MRFSRSLAAVLVTAMPLLSAAQQLTVSAAASLTDAFRDIATRFGASRPGVTVRLNFAASGVLLQQISQGAPVDVFASADEATVLRGIERTLLDARSRRDFAGNAIVLVVPMPGGPPITTLAGVDAPGVRRIAVGNPVVTPVGRYTKEALETAKLWRALESRFVLAQSARQVLDYVARGEADAGFVYRSDAASAGGKVRIALTLDRHEPVRYPALVVSDSRNKALAADFIAFLSTPAAQDVLAKAGFDKAPP